MGEVLGRVAIVTDSVAQVPPELVSQLGIRVVPSIVLVAGQKFLDGSDLNPDGLYQRMRLEKDLRLSTAAPSAGMFYSTYLECLQAGAESVLYVGLSSRLSATFSAAENGAVLAREELGERQIVLYDTRLATIAQGFLVIEAARLAQAGASLEQIVAQVDAERKRTGLAASLETLEYLARGGRIGKAAYMLSSMIHVLPVVSFSEDGEVVPVARVRGQRHALEMIVAYAAERVAGCSSLSLAVMHADAEQRARELQALASERLQPQEIFITHFTPVMAVHAGPGIIGLAFHWRP